MHYEGNIIRPPSEANSILLQVTVGCSRNKCTFCGAYQGERFKIKSDEIIMADIAFAATHCQRQRRVFLCDGDAMIIPQKRLMNILGEIRRQLPWVTRVGVYANAKSLKMKTPEELKALRENGLGIAYMGLETGDDVTLKAINKGANAQPDDRHGPEGQGRPASSSPSPSFGPGRAGAVPDPCPGDRPGACRPSIRSTWAP
jgi:radical SAM superfamily enzyme YgiQ (UPF0313 family)